eukprot:6381139-Alexandrium_andersonii.AAC.1
MGGHAAVAPQGDPSWALLEAAGSSTEVFHALRFFCGGLPTDASRRSNAGRAVAPRNCAACGGPPSGHFSR